MTDRTTAGVEPEPDEVEALLHNLCGFHLADRDPVSRYAVLTREQALYEALAEAIRRERGRALAELVARGHRPTEVATLTGLRTRQQVQRLVQLSTTGELAAETVAEAQEASRQFEERLDAVEATLDEVVSGVPIINEPAVPVSELTDDYDSMLAKEPFVVEPLPSGAFATVRSAAYPTIGSGYPGVRVTMVDDDFDPLTADLDQLAGVLEPTQVVPSLPSAMQPTKELATDEPWFRRTDDSAAG